jgi:hypothetical protein
LHSSYAIAQLFALADLSKKQYHSYATKPYEKKKTCPVPCASKLNRFKRLHQKDLLSIDQRQLEALSFKVEQMHLHILSSENVRYIFISI